MFNKKLLQKSFSNFPTFFHKVHQNSGDNLVPLDDCVQTRPKLDFLLAAAFRKKLELRFAFFVDDPEDVTTEMAPELHELLVQRFGVDHAALEQKNFSAESPAQLPVVNIKFVHFLELSLVKDVNLRIFWFKHCLHKQFESLPHNNF